jgi:hypothetical protein
MWIWGLALFLLYLSIVGAFIVASLNINAAGEWPGAGAVHGYYVVIKNNQPVFAALVATLGVIWSWFFQMSYGQSKRDRAGAWDQLIDALKAGKEAE